MRVEWQVVGGHREIRAEHRSQALGALRGQAPGPVAEEQPVMDDRKVGPGVDRRGEELEVRRHPGRQAGHLLGARDL
jgi:hypothetical protein